MFFLRCSRENAAFPPRRNPRRLRSCAFPSAPSTSHAGGSQPLPHTGTNPAFSTLIFIAREFFLGASVLNKTRSKTPHTEQRRGPMLKSRPTYPESAPQSNELGPSLTPTQLCQPSSDLPVEKCKSSVPALGCSPSQAAPGCVTAHLPSLGQPRGAFQASKGCI